MYPRVLSEFETIELLLKEGKSIARYGDGELKLCLGRKNVSQEYHPRLGKRLVEILKSNDEQCVIGIPHLHPLERIAPDKREFWGRYTHKVYADFYDPNKVYGSAFITRPDNVPEINTLEFFERVQDLWLGRHVVLINGDDSRAKFDKDESFMDGAANVDRWLFPRRDAWAVYMDIFEKCRQQQMDTLFILALGATATVLAYDLALAGFQALDLGHLGRFYAKFTEEHHGAQ